MSVRVKTKVCSRCKERKPVSNFTPRSDRVNQRHSFCKPCQRAYVRERKANNGAQQRYYQRHKERILSDPKRRRAHKDNWLWTRYRIRLVDAERLVEEQNGLCAICKQVPVAIVGQYGVGRGNGSHVDHDHVTGAVRGILCLQCNFLLGYAHDDVLVLENAIRYLKEA